jgi:hypothetical protein
MTWEGLILCGLYIKGQMAFGTALERLSLGKIPPNIDVLVDMNQVKPVEVSDLSCIYWLVFKKCLLCSCCRNFS